MRKLSILAVAAAVAVPVVLASPVARAQDIQLTGPLAGAPAVRQLKRYRRGRVGLAPMGYFTVNDEFMRHVAVGGRVEYNVFDFLAIGAFGAYTLVGVPTRLADEVKDKGVYDQLNYPYSDRDHPRARDIALFENQLGLIQYVGGVQASLVPFRGKFSLFGRAYIDADVFLFLGVGAVGLRERGEAERGRTCSGNDVLNEAQQEGACLDTVQRTTFAPTFGGGMNMYLNDFVALTFEYRMMPFSWNTSGTDEAGRTYAELDDEFPDGNIDEEDDLLLFNQFFNVGVVFHLPTIPTISE